MPYPKTFTKLLATGIVVLFSGSANAAGVQDLASIREAAELRALDIATGIAPDEAQVRVTAGPLDSRLRLAACDAGIQSFATAGQTGMPTSVGVRCPGTTPWSLYVPVRVEVIANVLVLSAPGFRGQRIGAGEVSLEPRDIARMTRGYLTDPAAIENMVLRRQLTPGTVLTPSHLEMERIVHRGERVELRAGAGALSVSVEAEAMADAARGERVRVRNVASGRIVEGIVESAGLVVMSRQGIL